MKNRDKILKKFAITMTAVLCIFGLALGITQAQNNTGHLTRGESETVITEKQITEFVNSYFNSVKSGII